MEANSRHEVGCCGTAAPPVQGPHWPMLDPTPRPLHTAQQCAREDSEKGHQEMYQMQPAPSLIRSSIQ